MMDQKELLDILTKAISDFYANDYHLIDNQASERSIIASIQCNLKSDTRLESYHIDVEYNREGSQGEQKRNWEEIATTADLVIHNRGNTESGNLLYIEAKTDFNISEENKKADIETIKYFKSKYKYKFGIFIEIGKRFSKIIFINDNENSNKEYEIKR